jgi:hypothetical protein
MRIACKILRWNKTTPLREIESAVPPELKSTFYPASAFAIQKIRSREFAVSLGISPFVYCYRATIRFAPGFRTDSIALPEEMK